VILIDDVSAAAVEATDEDASGAGVGVGDRRTCAFIKVGAGGRTGEMV
jgi:hypothetical protein